MVAYCGTPVALTLTLGAATLDLMDTAKGFRVATLELGYPDVREVVSPVPTRDGSYDSTRYFGTRVVTITGSLIPSAMGSRTKALDALTPYLDPSARPYLTYQLDADGSPRLLGIRASALSVPHSNPQITAFSVSWKSLDPIAISSTQTTVTINPGASATCTNNGNFRSWPSFRIHGPCTNPVINVTAPVVGKFAMVLTSIAAGHYFDCDMYRRIVTDDTGANKYALVDFPNTTWPPLQSGANTVTFNPATSAGGCSVDVVYRDSWL